MWGLLLWFGDQLLSLGHLDMALKTNGWTVQKYFIYIYININSLSLSTYIYMLEVKLCLYR